MASIEEVLNTLRQSLSPKANFFPPGSSGYNQVTLSYFWSSSKQNPVGVFQPGNAEDVSLILKAISDADPAVKFAIKAGSHIAPKGFNSTTGLLIDMSLFNEVSYNPETKLVDVGPGMLWQGVYEYLIPNGRNVNGATSCQGVGVAGFNLGGGYGNKANQFGLAMDTVKAVEVVLPNGEIRTANKDRDPEIFWALKGGGNNFGVVTKWTMETHEQGKIYFMALNYDHKYFDQVQNAIWDYIQNQIPKSNVETKFEWTTTERGNDEAVPISHAELFYDGPEPPKGLFEAFLDIPHICTKKASSWEELMGSLPNQKQTYRIGWGAEEQVDDLPDTFRGRYTCVMLSRYTPALIKQIVELAEEAAQGLKDYGGLQLYPDIWPGHPEMFRNSPPAAWPHGSEALFPLPIRCLWEHKKNDQHWINTLTSLTENIRKFAIEQGCTEEQAPLYYNLALDDTKVSLIYRENLSQLVELRTKYDPFRVMDRTGGFRIPTKQLK